MTKVIFLDIDGPMIPGRARYIEGQTKVLSIFDPCAVGFLNNFCQAKGWRIVISSSWVRVFGEEKTYEHCLNQGLKAQYFHPDKYCSGEINWRYTRIAKFLSDHPDITKYIILDDEPYCVDIDLRDSLVSTHPEDMEDHLFLVDYNQGITFPEMELIRRTANAHG